jgi:hypothetical protein
VLCASANFLRYTHVNIFAGSSGDMSQGEKHNGNGKKVRNLDITAKH